MLTGKQKKYLKQLAMELTPVVQIGKNGLDDAVIDSTLKAINKRELIKVKLNQNTAEETESALNALALAVEAELVQIIGKNGVLFKQKKKDSRIELPQ